MKKIVFVIPFIAISLLASCGSNPSPNPGVNYYFVSFETFGGTHIDTQRVKEGDKVIPPNDPVREDDDFKGWFIDMEYETSYTFNETVTDDITLYAKWDRTFQITLDAGEGKFSTGKNKITFKVAENVNLSKVLKSIDRPTKDNDTFASYTYYVDDSSVEYDDRVTSDLILNANYSGSPTPLTDLDEVSWKMIHDVAVTNNKIDTCFALGASKHIDVYGYNHELRIIGFNHDELSISTKENPLYAGITFEFFNVITKFNEKTQTPLCVTVCWEYSELYNYKYTTSTLRNFLNEGSDSILSELQDELKDEDLIKEVYRPVTEKQTAESNYEINTSYTDKLFPLSYHEVIGERHSETLDEGIQYPYWKIHNTGDERKKYDVGGSTERGYWLRSPVINATDDCFAWVISTNGLPDDKTAIYVPPYNTGLPIAPAFCI